ncbi:MAG: 1-phosphofructokinase family hexose kinase [Thermoleophilaceae bacterium]
MVIAGPNLTIDRTLTIEELRPGEVLRFESAAITPGGKGVNVARVARALGAPALLVGFTPGHTGDAAARLIAREGLELRAVEVEGELRAAIVVLERGGRVTVLNEPGPELRMGDWERYEAAVAESLAEHSVLVCSGSLPPGAPPEAYARLTTLAARAGTSAIVDGAGEVLAAALEAHPDVVTPNLAEAEGLLHGRADESVEAGDPAEVRARAGAAAVELVRRGARAAVVTAGAAGAAVADGSTVIWHPAQRVAVHNPIGAGDSFAGGMAAALERGEPLDSAAAFGLASAAASVESETAGVIDPARAAELAASAPPAEALLN